MMDVIRQRSFSIDNEYIQGMNVPHNMNADELDILNFVGRPTEKCWISILFYNYTKPFTSMQL